MRGIEIPCQEIVEWVTDYLEGALSAERHRLFVEHLAECEPCTRYVEQIRTVHSALGEVADDDLTPQAWDALRTVLRGVADQRHPDERT